MRQWNGFESDTAGPSVTGTSTGAGQRERRDAKVVPIVQEELQRRSLVSSGRNKSAALLKKVP